MPLPSSLLLLVPPKDEPNRVLEEVNEGWERRTEMGDSGSDSRLLKRWEGETWVAPIEKDAIKASIFLWRNRRYQRRVREEGQETQKW